MAFKRANVLASVLIAVVILAAGTVVISKTIGTKQQKIDEQQRLVAEADTLMRQAIAYGINDWMKSGFSDKNMVWYSNYPIPPDFNEAKTGLNTIVNQKAQAYMEKLRKENDKYSIAPEVRVEFVLGPSLTEPDKTALHAKVSDFKVGLKTEDYSQIEDISGTYDYAYKAWMIYDTMHRWHQTNADQLTQSIWSDALLARPCQLVTGACDCAETGFSAADKEYIKLTANDVTAVLDARLAALQAMFTDQAIKCRYDIEMMDIQNTESTVWTVADAGPNGTNVVLRRESDYTYELMQWDESKTLPSPGSPNGGLPIAGTGTQQGVVYRPIISVDKGYTRDYNETDIRTETCDGAVTRMGGLLSGGANLAQSMKIGMLAMDKKASGLIKFRCEDTGKSIEAVGGLEPLAGEIEVRFALALDCPIPNDVRDTYVDESLYHEPAATCPGGSCFPAGTMISMADGSKKAIEDVKVGDAVLSFNTYTGEMRSGEVLELESPVREGLYTIAFADGSNIEVTNEHPFYVKKASGALGWASIMPEETYKETKTIDNVMPLVVGDAIMRQDSTWAAVTAIAYDEGVVQTYNLKEVSAYDNFFADELLAHNKCCFAAGTPVTMADGTTKPIEEVKVGDFVMSYNLALGKSEPAEVLSLQQPVRDGLYLVKFASGNELKVTNDHPLYAKFANGQTGWAAIDVEAALAGYALNAVHKLAVGDEILQQDGTYDAVTETAFQPGPVQTYTLKKVSKNMNFFANGYLAHNQKMIGFIGLACPIDCQPCYGCAPADGVASPQQGVDEDWQCVPTPNLICGKCGLCDVNAQCTIPQNPGYPCFNGETRSDGTWDGTNDNLMAGDSNSDNNYADCWACDGLGPGDANCVMNPAQIVDLISVPCEGSGPCAQCSGTGVSPSSGGCAAPLRDDATCNDMSISEGQRECMICPAGQTGACTADSTMEGELCDDCATCLSGMCTGAAPESDGVCASDARPCMKCSDTQAGACQVDLSKDNSCDACEMCGGIGSCVADPGKLNMACDECKVCDGSGNCIPGPDGVNCGSDSGCIWQCQAGECRLTNQGSSCTRSSNKCGLAQTCTDSGCETVASEENKFCCGTAKCNAGSPCCAQENICSQCPTPT